MGSYQNDNFKKSNFSMRVLALVCLLFATAFAGTKRQNAIASFKACKNAVQGTKLHWNCGCGVATKKNGGLMSENCEDEKNEVIANQKKCAIFRQKFADNYDMFFEDSNDDFIVAGSPKPNAEQIAFHSKFC